MSQSLQRIRVLSDGRRGHENQSLGLAEALARRTGATVDVVRLPPTFLPWPRFRAALNGDPAPPQLVIGAGHKTHLPLWYAARRWRIPSVVIMRPTWPLALFSLCLAPRHDWGRRPPHPKVVVTLGALNRLPEERPPKEPLGMILLGGPSRHHGWAGDKLPEAIAEVVAARPELRWTVTDSPRTPAGFLEAVEARLPEVEAVSWRRTDPGWLPDRLLRAEEAWVTRDSVSMIFESLTAGARTGLLPAPVLRPREGPPRAVEDLIAGGWVAPYEQWRTRREPLPPPRPLHETGRCADLILDRFFR
ncbi:MAG: hypothetical protein D6766_08210 [Verrucomicrobia bacterium]|nr:MAG: hypothetical protein D6766_08210 [Verrucomicrobiota bacterium]